MYLDYSIFLGLFIVKQCWLKGRVGYRVDSLWDKRLSYNWFLLDSDLPLFLVAVLHKIFLKIFMNLVAGTGLGGHRSCRLLTSKYTSSFRISAR